MKIKSRWGKGMKPRVSSVEDPKCPRCGHVLSGKFKPEEKITCSDCKLAYEVGDLIDHYLHTKDCKSKIGGGESYADWDSDASGYQSVAKKILEEGG